MVWPQDPVSAQFHLKTPLNPPSTHHDQLLLPIVSVTRSKQPPQSVPSQPSPPLSGLQASATISCCYDV